MQTNPRSKLPALAAVAACLGCMALTIAPARADEVPGEADRAVEVGGAGVASPTAQSCDEVSSRLRQEAGAAGNADLQLAAARCDLRAGRTDDALAHLRAARAAAPGRGDVDLWEGIARFDRGELEAALALLDAAQGIDDADRGLLLLYRGRALLEQARRLESLDVIDRDRRRPLRVVEPVDLFYAANPWPQDVLRARAERDLEGAAELDPSGELADAVRAALAEVDAPRGPWVAGSVELAADETFTLLGSGTDTPYEIARTNGLEFVPALTVQGGGEVFRWGPVSGGLLGAFYGIFPTETDDLDTAYPTATAFLDTHISERMTFRTRYDFGYAWVDGDDFALTNDLGLELHNRSDRWGEMTVWSRLYYNVFYDDQDDFPFTDGVVPGICDSTLLPPPFPPTAPSCSSDPLAPDKAPLDGARRDRSGWGFLFGGRMRKSFDWNETEVRGGYTYQHYIPDGAEFHNQSHGVDVGVNTALPLGFRFDAWVAFTYQGFRNISVYPEPPSVLPNRVWTNKDIRRHERAWEVALELQRRVFENVQLWLGYRYLDNDANYKAFDYDRNVVGVGVSAILY